MTHFSWWSPDNKKEALAGAVFSAVDSIKTEQHWRHEQMKKFVSIYENREFAGIEHHDYDHEFVPLEETLIYNAIESIIDHIVAMVTKDDPRPMVLTEQGSYSVAQRAKGLNRFLEGEMSAHRVYELAAMAFRDACIFGSGILKLQQREGQISIDRVYPHHLHAPSKESYYGKPRSLHHVYYVNSQVLRALFPKARSSIEDLAQRLEDDRGVEVIESWHLPSGRDAGDGRRTICIQNMCLLDEEWEHGDFPFAIIHFKKLTMGFWGRGLVQSLRHVQAHLDDMTQLIADSIRLTARPIGLKKRGAELSNDKLKNNKLGAIYDVNDMDDFRYVTTDAVPPSAIAERKELWDKIFSLSGAGQLGSQAKKPSGLDSAVALREFEDIESARFATQYKAYETLVLDVARQFIRLAREAHDQGHDVEVKVRGKSASRQFIETIRWSEVDLEDSKFDMDLFPVNSLPRSPAGRLAYITELMKGDLIDKKQGLRLLDFPDVKAVTDVLNAPIDDIFRIAEGFLDGGPYEPPDPINPELQDGVRLMQCIYLEHREDATDAAREKMLRWVSDAIDLLNSSQPQQQPQAPAGAGPQNGMASGGPMPMSETLPPGAQG